MVPEEDSRLLAKAMTANDFTKASLRMAPKMAPKVAL